MSNTKGSMLISNANAVGTELVNQLGGTGYKPSEWSDAINLLGISDDDKASALAGITEGTYTGTERGAIKYSNCNAVGAMLNKKFSTNRGFKPVEWESAISKLTPLSEGTVSGAICNIVNGAEYVPLKNWLVTLPASLDGYSEVNGVRSWKNLFDKDNADIVNGYIDVSSFNVNNNRAKTIYIPIKGGATYTVSKTVGARFSIATASVIPSSGAVYTSRQTGNTSASLTITASSNDKYLWAWVFLDGTDSGTLADMLASVQIEYGSTATAYEAYTAPTTYTVSLGRTIYGGTADIVTGEGEDEYSAPITLDGTENWQKHGSIASWFYVDNLLVDAYANNSEIGFIGSSWGTQKPYSQVSSLANGEFAYGAINRLVFKNTDFTEVADFKNWLLSNPITLVYKLTTAYTFTFTPITPTPETALGVNNFWAEQGDSTITYRKDPDIPDPPVQLLNMNNNNEDNNEGV